MTVFFHTIFLILSLLVVIKSADLAIKYSSRLAKNLGISNHIVGFMVIAFISILPETLIAITSALEGSPSFGLGTLFGSNVADLTLVFAMVTFFSWRSIKIGSKILTSSYWYILVLILPLFFGFNGHFSRLEGLLLIVTGSLFYFWLLRRERRALTGTNYIFSFKYLLYLVISMAILLLGAHLTVKYGLSVAQELRVNPILIGMLVVGLGTTLPEMFFSVKAVRHHYDSLALADILGTVLSDATIVVGLVAVISPFDFNPRIIYITGLFMLCAALFLFQFMRTDKKLTKREAILLVLFYLLFVVTEFLINK